MYEPGFVISSRRPKKEIQNEHYHWLHQQFIYIVWYSTHLRMKISHTSNITELFKWRTWQQFFTIRSQESFRSFHQSFIIMSNIVSKCRWPLIITTDIYFLELKKKAGWERDTHTHTDRRGINGKYHIHRSIFQFAAMFLTLK